MSNQSQSVNYVCVITLTSRNLAQAEAVSHFEEGFNCAQSVLLAMQRLWEVEKTLEPKVASAFGGGIGRVGSVCGALTGGVIAIGLKYGTNNPSAEEREKAYSLARKFYTQFRKECGSVSCRELIGYDLTDPKELEKARRSNVFKELRSFHRKNS